MKQFYFKAFCSVSISIFFLYFKKGQPKLLYVDSTEQTKKIGKIEFSKELKRRNSIITKCCVCHGL